MIISKEIFCSHFWGSRVNKIPEKTKKERYEDFCDSNMPLGKYIVFHSRIRPGMLVKITPVFSRSPLDNINDGDIAIFIEYVQEPRAGERWFRIFHDGEVKEVLDIELYEVLLEAL